MRAPGRPVKRRRPRPRDELDRQEGRREREREDAQVKALVALDATAAGEVAQLGVPVEVPDLVDVAGDGGEEGYEAEDLDEREVEREGRRVVEEREEGRRDREGREREDACRLLGEGKGQLCTVCGSARESVRTQAMPVWRAQTTNRDTRLNRTSRSCARDEGAAESMAGSCRLV